MTTTELIELLKSVEFGASGRAREISFRISHENYIFEPYIKIDCTGDGVAGAELCLRLDGDIK
jgi:hypothetical protein